MRADSTSVMVSGFFSQATGLSNAHSRAATATDRALGAAVGDDRDLAEAELERRLGMRDMEHEGRAAEDRRVDECRGDPEILGECEARRAGLRRGAEETVNIAQCESAIGEHPVSALRHQV